MRKIKLYTTSLLMMSVLLIGFSSCAKKCKIEKESVDSGLIVKDVSIYPAHGYITQDMSGDYHVHGGSAIADKFEMSTDEGQTRSPFNYTAYSILAYPMTLNCNFKLDRSVSVNDVAQTATYKIIATQCKEATCAEQRFIENFIAVPAIPSSYTILHDIQIIEQ